jgi:hypothetical protein
VFGVVVHVYVASVATVRSSCPTVQLPGRMPVSLSTLKIAVCVMLSAGTVLAADFHVL